MWEILPCVSLPLHCPDPPSLSPSQLLLVGNFLEKMLCIIGTWAGIVYTLARCVKWFLAGVLVDLTAQNTAKEVQE